MEKVKSENNLRRKGEKCWLGPVGKRFAERLNERVRERERMGQRGRDLSYVLITIKESAKLK